MSQCPPALPISSDPAIIQLGNQIQQLYQGLNSPSSLMNTLNTGDQKEKPTSGGLMHNSISTKGQGQPMIVGDFIWIITVPSIPKQFMLEIRHIGPDTKSAANHIALKDITVSAGTLSLNYFSDQIDGRGHVIKSTSATTPVTFAMVPVTVVTDIRVSGVTLQYKTRKIYVLEADDESGWTTWATGTTCDS